MSVHDNRFLKFLHVCYWKHPGPCQDQSCVWHVSGVMVGKLPPQAQLWMELQPERDLFGVVVSYIRVLSGCVPRHLFLSSETRNCFPGKQGNSGKETLRVFAKPQNRHITSARLQQCSDLRGYPWRNCSERLPQWNAFRVGGGKQKWKVVWEKGQRWYRPPPVLRPDPCVTAHECCAVEVWRPPGNPTPSTLCQLLLRASIRC